MFGNNISHSDSLGVDSIEVTNLSFRNNMLFGNYNGAYFSVHLWTKNGVRNGVLKNNSLMSAQNGGMDILFAENVTVVENYAENSFGGASFSLFGHNSTVSDNTVVGIPYVWGGIGIGAYPFWSSNITAEGNTLWNGNEIEVLYTNESRFSWNDVEGGGSIDLASSSYNLVDNNTVSNCTNIHGFGKGGYRSVTSSIGNRLYHNHIRNCSDHNNRGSVSLSQSPSTMFGYNTVEDSNFHGIWMVLSDDTHIFNSTVNNSSQAGIAYERTVRLLVENSTITNSAKHGFMANVSANGTSLNTTFSSADVDSTSVLVVKNFLHIKTYDTDQSTPLQNVDVVV
ncbi:MAG: right-handed parallel beta-helix repeat-containing protein, partial [Planctomycetes bacterium]|nr:right-handed parallel beta-helix repeat-containing protein [Planctomycetota bacterium]